MYWPIAESFCGGLPFSAAATADAVSPRSATATATNTVIALRPLKMSSLTAIRIRLQSRGTLTLAIAALTFGLALEGGGYGVPARSGIAIALGWTIMLGVGLSLLPLDRVPRAAVIVGGLLAAFALLTGASALWADDPEGAFLEFDRATLYLALFALIVLAARRDDARRWSDGLRAGIAAVGVLSLASRCFPHLLPAGDVARFLPAVETRLTYPVNYWNGLGILLALGLPLLLRPAIASRSACWRGLALAPIPALAAAIYLTSSRGAAAVAAVSVVAFGLLVVRRLAAFQAILVAAAGSAAAIAVLLPRDELVNGPIRSGAAVSQGRVAALLILLLCAATGAVHGVVSSRVGRLSIAPRLARPLAGLAVLLAVAGFVAADPSRRFDQFKEPPGEFAHRRPDFVRAHLLSGGGSGRWQFWGAAVDEFQTRPIAGRGAGSFEAWWAEHGSLAYFTRDAHSLYVETLGELGLLGLALLVATFGGGVASALRRLRVHEEDERTTVAALAAAFLGFLLGMGIDWMWELTVVGAVGIACLALLTGPATARRLSLVGAPPRRTGRFALGAVTVVVASALLCAQAIPWLTQREVQASQAAVRRGDLSAALDKAGQARAIQPWASSPYLQLALVREEMGDLAGARREIAKAIDRDGGDWRLWLVSARLATKAGAVADARRSLGRARKLNPRSPLFAPTAGGRGGGKLGFRWPRTSPPTS